MYQPNATRTRLALAVALVIAGSAAHAQAPTRSLVKQAGGGDAAWFTVGVSAQPAPVNDLTRAIEVPAGACYTAPCVEVSIDSSESPWPGGTEWTGRTAFTALDAAGRAITDRNVTIFGGTGIAQSRFVPPSRIFDDVRYRIANRNAHAVKVNVWAQLSKPPYQVYGVGATGATGTAVASGFSLTPYNGRIATTDAEAWPISAPSPSTDARTGVTTVTIRLDRPSRNTEATFGKLDQSMAWTRNGDTVVALPASFDGARLVNRNSGLCLSIDTSALAYGARASLATCDRAAPRTWYVANGGGDQRIVVAGASGHCLDLPGETRAYGAQTTTGTCTGHDSQRWVLANVVENAAASRAEVSLVNANSGYCLDVEGHGTRVGSRVTQGTCNGHASQRWTIEGTWY